MTTTPGTVRVVHARVERVVSPNVVDAYVALGMGVMILKRVTIDHAPGLPRPSRPSPDISPDDTFPTTNSEAMQCLIILCGGKRVILETNADAHEFHITARVGVRAKHAPEQTKWNTESHGPMLDVGRMMKLLSDRNDYDASAVRAALNGPQHHAKTST